MATDKQTGTNAADTAPGVDDGRATGRQPEHFTKPGGRGAVWIGVAVVVLILLIVFVAGPGSGDRKSASQSVPPASSSPAEPGATAPPQ